MTTKTLQVIQDGVVNNVILVSSEAAITADGSSVAWDGASIDAPDGSVFMEVTGAQIGWIASGQTLVAPPNNSRSSESAT